MKRAVLEAVDLLRDKGHQIVPYKPPHLKEILKLAWQIGSVGSHSMASLLKGNPVDKLALGHWKLIQTLPKWLRNKLSPVVSFFGSPIIGGSLKIDSSAQYSYQLWQLNAKRLELTEKVLHDWVLSGIDVVIAPGFPMPAQLIEYPAYFQSALGATCVYNLLNFPVGSQRVNI